ANDSVRSPHVKVGHRQGFIKREKRPCAAFFVSVIHEIYYSNTAYTIYGVARIKETPCNQATLIAHNGNEADERTLPINLQA
ncbi:hypothetical protein ACD661_16845, partial [Legionella lytica]